MKNMMDRVYGNIEKLSATGESVERNVKIVNNIDN